MKFMRDEYDFSEARNNPDLSLKEERHFEFTALQIKEIEQARHEADAGQFASVEDLAIAITKYRS
jgi:hypothetical protein